MIFAISLLLLALTSVEAAVTVTASVKMSGNENFMSLSEFAASTLTAADCDPSTGTTIVAVKVCFYY